MMESNNDTEKRRFFVVWWLIYSEVAGGDFFKNTWKLVLNPRLADEETVWTHMQGLVCLNCMRV